MNISERIKNTLLSPWPAASKAIIVLAVYALYVVISVKLISLRTINPLHPRVLPESPPGVGMAIRFTTVGLLWPLQHLFQVIRHLIPLGILLYLVKPLRRLPVAASLCAAVLSLQLVFNDWLWWYAGINGADTIERLTMFGIPVTSGPLVVLSVWVIGGTFAEGLISAAAVTSIAVAWIAGRSRKTGISGQMTRVICTIIVAVCLIIWGRGRINDLAVNRELHKLGSADAVQRIEAVRFFAETGDHRSSALIAELMLKDQDSRVRVEAAKALSSLAAPPKIEALEKAAADPSAEVREAAGKSLERLKTGIRPGIENN